MLGTKELRLWSDSTLGSARLFIATAKGLMWCENKMKPATFSIIDTIDKGCESCTRSAAARSRWATRRELNPAIARGNGHEHEKVMLCCFSGFPSSLRVPERPR